jgi:hypothetical protein
MRKWFFIVLLFILTNCHKSESMHFPIPQTFKDVALFNKNSYWIYLNEKTSKTDSTYITSDPQFFTTSTGTDTFDDIIITFEGSLFTQEYLRDIFVSLHSTIMPDFTIIVFSNYTIIEKFDSLNVNSHKFVNVFHTRQSSLTSKHDSIFFDTYLAPHIGIIKIIKKQLGTDSTFSLVRWRVSQ